MAVLDTIGILESPILDNLLSRHIGDLQTLDGNLKLFSVLDISLSEGDLGGTCRSEQTFGVMNQSHRVEIVFVTMGKVLQFPSLGKLGTGREGGSRRDRYVSDPSENIGGRGGFLHRRPGPGWESGWEIINDWLDILGLGIGTDIDFELLLGGPFGNGLGSGVAFDDIRGRFKLDSLVIRLHGSREAALVLLSIGLREVVSGYVPAFGDMLGHHGITPGLDEVYLGLIAFDTSTVLFAFPGRWPFSVAKDRSPIPLIFVPHSMLLKLAQIERIVLSGFMTDGRLDVLRLAVVFMCRNGSTSHAIKGRFEADLERYLGLEQGVVGRVNGGWMRFTVLAQVVIGTVGVHALVSDTSDMLIATITNDVRMSSAGLTTESGRVDNIGRPGEFDKRVSGMSVVNGLSARGATIPVGTVETFPSDANDR